MPDNVTPSRDGTFYFDELKYPKGASSGGDGSSAFTGGIFASDYIGSLANNTAASTLGGSVGFFYDSRLSSTKIWEEGGVSGSTGPNPAGILNFYYGIGKSAATRYTDAYFGGFVNAPGNVSANASSFSNLKLKFWGDAETWEKSNFTPNPEIVLQGPKNVACTNPSGRPEISKTVTGQKIGAASEYTIQKAQFTLVYGCGGAYTIDTVWSAINVVVVQLTGTSLQYTNSVSGGSYPTFLNIGPISFTN